MQGLTSRQKEILEFISARIEEHGYPPTIREIGEHMGIRSTNGVNDHLKALERKGFLQREGLKSRALRPVQLPASPSRRERGGNANVLPTVLPSSGNVLSIPVMGRVAAGSPILADENVEKTLQVDSFLVGAKANDKIFALRVSGDSMIEGGIMDGDYIFVKKQLEARKGQVVVAMIDGEATVKRYEPEGDVIKFVPENSSMKPIVVKKSDFRSTQILGVVCGVYRRVFS